MSGLSFGSGWTNYSTSIWNPGRRGSTGSGFGGGDAWFAERQAQEQPLQHYQ